MNKKLVFPSLLFMSIGLAACSSQPNQNLEDARSQFKQLQSDPRASQLAALETEDAARMMERADKAYLNDDDSEKVDQLAYLTKRRVEVAEQTIALRTAEQELEKASAKRAEARLESREQLLKRQQDEIRRLQQDLQAKQTVRGTLVTFGDVLFDVDKAELKPAGHRDIRKLADFLNDNPERKVIVEGHTDSTGSAAYNLQLSERRAEAVRRALIRAGVDGQRINTVGYGKDFPVASNDSSSGRAMNRRVEVTISHDDQRVAPRQQAR